MYVHGSIDTEQIRNLFDSSTKISIPIGYFYENIHTYTSVRISPNRVTGNVSSTFGILRNVSLFTIQALCDENIVITRSCRWNTVPLLFLHDIILLLRKWLIRKIQWSTVKDYSNECKRNYMYNFPSTDSKLIISRVNCIIL